MENNYSLTLKVLDLKLAICKLDPSQDIPQWAKSDEFSSITRTKEELSIICPQELIPKDIECEKDYLALKVLGPLDLSLVGVTASLTRPIANAKIPIFTFSTFDTDYILIKESHLDNATKALEEEGHIVE